MFLTKGKWAKIAHLVSNAQWHHDTYRFTSRLPEEYEFLVVAVATHNRKKLKRNLKTLWSASADFDWADGFPKKEWKASMREVAFILGVELY